MARRFVAASSQFAQVAATRAPAYPLTMACWYRPTTSAATMTAISLGRSTGATPNHYWALGVTSAAKPFVETRAGGSAADALHATSVANGTWTHLCGVLASATSHIVYKDGVNPVTDATSLTPVSLDTTTIGALQNGTTRSSFANADIAEVAIWNVALAANEVAMLSAGVSPLLVRPANLACYVPVLGVGSPEQDFKITPGFTVTGATVIDHPRVFDSHAPLVGQPIASGNQSTSVTGIGSAGGFGSVTTAQGGVTISMTGLSSAAGFGTITAVPGARTASVSGISSSASFGAISFNTGPVTASVSGLASAAIFGSVTPHSNINAGVTGLASAASFGTITLVVGGVTVVVGGLNSAQQFGNEIASGGAAATFDPAAHGGRTPPLGR